MDIQTFDTVVKHIEAPDGDGYHVRIHLKAGGTIEGAWFTRSGGTVRVEKAADAQPACILISEIAAVERV